MQFTFPPIFYVKAFWEALSFALAGVLGLLVVLGVLPSNYALSAATLLAIFLTALKWIDITPQLEERKALLARKPKAKK